MEAASALLDNHREADGELLVDPSRMDIVLDNVSFKYEGNPILHNINIRIPANKTVAIVGESGAGKTTVFGLLTGLLVPQDGRVLVGDTDYRDIKMASLRSCIGYVTQDPVIFHDTVANNISLWETLDGGDEALKRVSEVSELAHCREFIERMPEGMETVVGEKGVKMSGGQRQRIAIAREIYKEPRIMTKPPVHSTQHPKTSCNKASTT